MSLPRCVEPEWLDELPADDPRAIRSRRDLSRVNAWMLQTGIMARLLAKHRGGEPPRAIVELGAGDGSFMLGIARRMASRWPGVTVVSVDRQNIVSDQTRQAFRAVGWKIETVTADIFDFFKQRTRDADIVTANLFLHHFSRDELARLLAGASALAPLFVACEPRRSPLALAASHLLIAIGCNDVSRHDAVVSVRAGFSGHELSQLWPATGGWTLHEHAAMPFTHCFAARRLG